MFNCIQCLKEPNYFFLNLDGFHLHDYLPSVCAVIKNSTETIHLFQKKLFNIEIKLDFTKSQLINSDLFDISYKIAIYDLKFHNHGHFNNNAIVERVISADQIIEFKKLYNHEYIIELTSIVRSDCDASWCPYVINNTIMCEKCKKKVFKLTNSRDETEDQFERNKCKL